MNLEDNELLVIGTSGHSAKYFFERLAKENYQKMQALMSDVIILMKMPKVFGEAFSSLLFIENITIIFLWVFII